MDFNIGQTFGDYLITGVISAGNTGQVFQVEHRLTRRAEAMKVLSTDHADEVEIKRFEREIRALARLNHPGIAALHSAIRSEQHLIVLMELVEGQTLESMLSEGRLPFETGLAYIQQVLLALEYAHKQGVVHRDVTPANIVITERDEVKVTNFGLAKSVGDPLLTTCGEILGSLAYLAPERLKGTTHPDPRSDLYSTAAILYELLTGRKPFGPDRKLAPVLTDSEAPPEPPSAVNPALSPRWDEIIARTLHRDPARRYSSAGEFLVALSQLDPASRQIIRARYWRALAAGAAAGCLTLTFLASPAIRGFASAEPVLPSPRTPHVSPPAFAFSIPRLNIPVEDSKPAPNVPVADSKPVRRTRPKSSNRPAPEDAPALAHRSSAEPDAAITESNIIVTRPVVPMNSLAHPPALSSAVLPPPAIPAKATTANDPTSSTPPAAAQFVEPTQLSTPKKTFWGKLNVFRRRHRNDPKSVTAQTEP